MKLSHYVVEDKDHLINLTTKLCIPKTSPVDVLQEHFFLEGQEQEAVDHVLFNTEGTFLNLTLNMTWECNLRCTHCFVLDKLVKKDNSSLDIPNFLDFIERYMVRFPSINTIACHFVGGEITLVSDQCLNVINGLKNRFPKLKFIFTATINGTILDDPTIELIKNCENVNISVDGNKQAHNDQRKSTEDFDPYECAKGNIKQLIEMGFQDKISIGAALTDKYIKDKNTLVEFYKDMLMIGVRKDHIHVGGVTPMKSKQSNVFKRYFRTQFFTRPCCKYRCGRLFQIDCNNKVYADYFEDYRESYLGELTSDISTILEKHRLVIKQQMPVLNDEKCKTCPVIGVCWGRCCNFKQDKPSQLCDQQFLIDKVKRYAQDGIMMERLLLTNAGYKITMEDKQ